MGRVPVSGPDAAVDSPRDARPADPGRTSGALPLDAEWLEADGLGGFASGTMSEARGRRSARTRERFLAPLHAHLREAGLGHVSEIADAEPPHVPRGCPFQTWSLAELLRLERDVLV
jgi:hypothetical protein